MELLLAEDDQGFAILLSMELEEQGNHVDMATNGLDGRSLGLRNHYDIIILDLMLPGMNGRQVCRVLKKNNISTPVLIMSALDSPDEKEACLLAGASDFIEKPFLFEDFYHKLLLIDKENRMTRNE
jgi:DNA-binding response OmpR family regulator